MFSPQEFQIITTLAYSAQFEFPLTVVEIEQNLVSVQESGALVKKLKISHRIASFNNLKTSQLKSAEIKLILRQLLNQGIVAQYQNYYCLSANLKTHKIKQLVESRLNKQKIARQLRRETKQIVSLVKKISGVLAVGLTGAVVFNNAEPDADLDMIVVVKKNRLWLTRLIVLWRSLLLGKKNLFRQGKKDHWCFNLWLAQEALALPKTKQNFYNALEASHIDWFYDPLKIRSSFYQSNRWLETYLANFKIKQSSVREPAPDQNYQFVLDTINQFVFALERHHLNRKNSIPQHNLSLEQAFLHDDMSYKIFMRNWQQQVKQVFSQGVVKL